MFIFERYKQLELQGKVLPLEELEEALKTMEFLNQEESLESIR